MFNHYKAVEVVVVITTKCRAACESSNFRSMSLANVKKSSFLDKLVKIALLYRPLSSPSLFLQNMKSWIDEKKNRYFA